MSHEDQVDTNTNGDSWNIPKQLRKEFSFEELEELKEQFTFVDTSGDGSLDIEELNTVMESLGIPIPHSKLAKLIEEVDDDRSGGLEFPEFLQLVFNLRSGGNAGLLGRFIQSSRQAAQIRAEFREMQVNAPHEVLSMSHEGNVRQCLVKLKGPSGSPYEKGIFSISVCFGSDYPYEAPVVKFITRIFHLNFVMHLNGFCSVSCILSEWDPSWRLRDVLCRIISLMRQPDLKKAKEIYDNAPAGTSGAPSNASHQTTSRNFGHSSFLLFTQDRNNYDLQARNYTSRFAMG